MMRMTRQDDLVRALRGLDEDVRRRVAPEAMVAAAQPIAEEARSLAPRNTGYGASVIDVGLWDESDTLARVAVGPGASGGRASRRDGFYLLFSEIGTGPRTDRNGADRGSMPRAPFLRPALDNQSGAALRIARQKIRQALGRAR